MARDGSEDRETKKAGDQSLQEVILELPMLADMELTASKTACAIGERIRMSPDKIDEVRMAVVEACINAFEYSKAEDEKVSIAFKILGPANKPVGLQVTVRDTGVGFIPEEVSDPDIDKKINSERKRGWGLKIMKGLMDECQVNSGAKGTTVVMRKLC